MVTLLLFVIGISIGSFLNVCIYRLPIGVPVFKVRSHCPQCKTPLKWFELIPLFSFFFLKRKCSNCKTKISRQYPVVEILSGVLLLLVVNREGISFQSAAMLMFCYAMLVIFFTDWQHLVIPNEVLAVAGVVWLIIQLLNGLDNFAGSIVSMLVAVVAIASITFLGNFLFKKQTVGMGDIKLAGILGLYLGWKIFLIVLWGAAIAGLLWGITAITILRVQKDSRLPFGSFLAFASIIAMFYRIDIEIFLAQYLYGNF